MIAKIGRSSNLFGALAYNNSKIEKDKGEILFTNKIIETADGKYSVAQLAKSFQPYLTANRNTEKHTLHISINPDPQDKVGDEKYKKLAWLYMDRMGYGDQPFIVFKHTDIDRIHIHIVSVCLDENGKKISDKFEKRRSMQVCRELEDKLGLTSAIDKQQPENRRLFKPVQYEKGDIKSQIASVIRHLPSSYQFQSLGEYNALLFLFNITAEKVEGELNGQLKRGLLYFPLDRKGEKAGAPFKSSLFGKNAGIDSLEKNFSTVKNKSHDSNSKLNLRAVITQAIHSSQDEQTFKCLLKKEGIDTVVRSNANGRIYGITFIDHHSRTVWNGSRLGKEYAANAFSNQWNKNTKPVSKESVAQQSSTTSLNDRTPPAGMPHHIFNLPDIQGKQVDSLFDALGGLLPMGHSEDYEEEAFAAQMKRKRKKKRPR
jgi:hypothetical protein